MPFAEPFTKKVAKQDLIYGIELGRRSYWNMHPEFMGKTHTIDEYRITDEEKKKECASQYEPQFLKAMAQHPKYASILDLGDLNETIRRKCKGGLDWATHNDLDMCVHFILDFVPKKKIPWKTLDDDIPAYVGPKSRGITGSELRALYRNRHDPAVQQRVQFWRDNKPTVPPWVSHPSYWQKYTPKSENVGGSASDANRFEAFPQFESFPEFASISFADKAEAIEEGQMLPSDQENVHDEVDGETVEFEASEDEYET